MAYEIHKKVRKYLREQPWFEKFRANVLKHNAGLGRLFTDSILNGYGYDDTITNAFDRPLPDKINYGGNTARSSKKEMKEFMVHGKKIMAYSKKDAIIKYKHLMS